MLSEFYKRHGFPVDWRWHWLWMGFGLANAWQLAVEVYRLTETSDYIPWTIAFFTLPAYAPAVLGAVLFGLGIRLAAFPLWRCVTAFWAFCMLIWAPTYVGVFRPVQPGSYRVVDWSSFATTVVNAFLLLLALCLYAMALRKQKRERAEIIPRTGPR